MEDSEKHKIRNVKAVSQHVDNLRNNKIDSSKIVGSPEWHKKAVLKAKRGRGEDGSRE